MLFNLAVVTLLNMFAYWQHHIILYVLSGMVTIVYGLNTAADASLGETDWIAGVAIIIVGIYTLFRAVVMGYGFFNKDKV